MNELIDDETIVIFTDGSCKPNPGRGGWAYIGITPGNPVFEIQDSGYHPHTTNNCMELTAIIEALKTFSYAKNILIRSDSQYAIKCAKKEWKRTKNIELWKEYDTLVMNKTILFSWVKGHSDNPYNTLVDKLANEEVDKHRKDSYFIKTQKIVFEKNFEKL